MKFLVWPALVVALAFGLAACSSGDESSKPNSGGESRNATLVLDFLPGAVHAGIYQALEQGYYADRGINLKVITPTATADTLKLVAAGKADFGIADGVDLGTQVADGRSVQGIMAITQRPSGGLITLEEENVTDPSALEGEKVGITGVPSDRAILDTVVEAAGGDPDQVDVVTLGFNGVQSLLAGKVKAFTGFIPADAVQIESEGYETRSFPLDEFGGPSYPGLVVFSTESKIGEDPDLMQDFVDATIKGYKDALVDPAEAIDALAARAQGIDKEFMAESFAVWDPRFGPTGSFGQFDQENLEALSDYLVENDLATEPISPDRYATTAFTDPNETVGE